MTTLNTPDQDDSRDTERGAEVVSLDAARAPQAAPDTAATDGPALEGEVVRVDKSATEPADWLADLSARARDRRPIVPPWLRSRREALATVKWVAGHYMHVSGYHATRTPKYGAKLAVRTPRGLVRLVSGTVRWTFDLEGHPVRMAAVTKADPEAYLKLSRQRDARVRLRVWIAGLAVAVVLAVGIVAAIGPPAARWAAIILAVSVLGVLGAPADRPLIDRAVVPPRVERLTSDIVVRALGALGIPAISQAIAKDPRRGIEFTDPIHRDGPGWRASVNLPFGVTATEVMDKRDKLASGLRRALGCVWPEAVPGDHPGRLALWVGYEDMSKARQPAWPLARHGTTDLFMPVPFGTDQRGRLVTVTLMFVSVIIGSIPRMGKTFLLRLLALIAALDPRAELHLYDLKGTGDLSPWRRWPTGTGPGMKTRTSPTPCMAMRGLREELRRRTKVIRGLPRDVCPESRSLPTWPAPRACACTRS